jgi:hypothetical protein
VLLLAGSLLISQVPAMGQGRSFTIASEAAQGQYQDDVSRQTSRNTILCTFCSSGYAVKRMGYYHRYALSGISLAYNLRAKSATGLQTIGLGLRGGRQRTGFQPLVPDGPFEAVKPPLTSSLALYDINPYLEGRATWRRIDLGYRAGIHIGRLLHQATTLADSSLQATWLAPDAQLWVGKRRVLFAQFDSGVGALAMGNYTSRFGLGSGMGVDDGRYLLAGLAIARNAPGYALGFLGASIPLFNSGLSAEPYAATNFSQHHQLHLRLSYQLLKAQ